MCWMRNGGIMPKDTSALSCAKHSTTLATLVSPRLRAYNSTPIARGDHQRQHDDEDEDDGNPVATALLALSPAAPLGEPPGSGPGWPLRGLRAARVALRLALWVLRLALWVLRLRALRVLRLLWLVLVGPGVCHPRDSALPPGLICAVAHYRDGLAHLLGGFEVDVGHEQLGVGPC